MRGKFKYLVVLFIICIFTAFLLSSSLFDIKNIYVYGNKQVTKTEIIKNASFGYGTNIFRINKMSAMKSIFSNAYIKLIKIRILLPNTINIAVVEREGIALVPYVGSFLNIDEEGMVLEIYPAIKKENLPVIKGMKFNTFKIGDILTIENKAQLDVATQIIKELKSIDMINQVSEIDISNTDNIMLQTKAGIKISFGGANDIRKKVVYAKSILEDLTKNKLKGTIEMSHEGNPIFKPE